MNKNTHGIPVISQALGLFKSRPRKVSKSTARRASVSKKSTRPNTPRHSSAYNPYQSASVSFDKTSCPCDAVRTIEDQRFLVREVPAIPLRNCDSPSCKCSYVRYRDRRGVNEDRRALFSLNTDLHSLGGEDERRAQRGRRSEDDPHFAASDADFDIAEWARH